MLAEWVDVDHNTDEWDLLRCDKITCSALGCVMANFGKAFGDPAKKYAVNIALGQITGKPQPQGYSNDHMERGHEDQHLAEIAYAAETFSDVKKGGFFYLDDFGSSPDGLVGEDGAIEIKCAIPSIHYDRIRKQSYDSAYKWQLVGTMMITGRKWIDFVSFCPEFPPDKRLYIVKLRASNFKEEFDMVRLRVNEFRRLIKETKETILNSKYLIEAA